MKCTNDTELLTPYFYFLVKFLVYYLIVSIFLSAVEYICIVNTKLYDREVYLG